MSLVHVIQMVDAEEYKLRQITSDTKHIKKLPIFSDVYILTCGCSLAMRHMSSGSSSIGSYRSLAWQGTDEN